MRARVRNGLFTGLYRCGRTLERAATLWFYAAAGAVRLADLRAAIRQEWEGAGGSQSDNYIASGLMSWERAFYLRLLKPGDRVLVVRCGTGRDLLAPLQLGYRAEGLDVGPQCTATARQVLQKRGLDTPLYTGAVETTELPGRFDAFIFSWFCYSYIPKSETRIHVLRKLREHLNPGFRILVTYTPAKTLPRRLPIQLISRSTAARNGVRPSPRRLSTSRTAPSRASIWPRCRLQQEAVVGRDAPVQGGGEVRPRGLDAAAGQLGQAFRIRLAGHQGLQDGATAHAQDVSEDAGELEVRVLQGLLDPKGMLRSRARAARHPPGRAIAVRK